YCWAGRCLLGRLISKLLKYCGKLLLAWRSTNPALVCGKDNRRRGWTPSPVNHIDHWRANNGFFYQMDFGSSPDGVISVRWKQYCWQFQKKDLPTGGKKSHSPVQWRYKHRKPV